MSFPFKIEGKKPLFEVFLTWVESLEFWLGRSLGVTDAFKVIRSTCDVALTIFSPRILPCCPLLLVWKIVFIHIFDILVHKKYHCNRKKKRKLRNDCETLRRMNEECISLKNTWKPYTNEKIPIRQNKHIPLGKPTYLNVQFAQEKSKIGIRWDSLHCSVPNPNRMQADSGCGRDSSRPFFLFFDHDAKHAEVCMINFTKTLPHIITYRVYSTTLYGMLVTMKMDVKIAEIAKKISQISNILFIP